MIFVRTPLRISFVGGGTDFEDFYKEHGGAVISATIDKYVYVTVNPKFDGDVRVSYSQTEIVPTSGELKHTRVKAVLEKLDIEKGVEIVTISDVPSGTGLGSSSALTVGLLKGLGSKGDLADDACEIEIGMLGEQIGKQDQYACAHGGLNLITFGENTINVSPIKIDTQELQNHLMFLYTGKTRLANSILRNKFDTEVLKKISKTVSPFYDALIKRDFYAMGKILHHGWMLKKQLDGVSNDEIDRVYETALDNGAWGGKILGAGGGGFLMLMVEPSKQEQVRQAIKWREVKFKFSNKGSEIIYQTTE